MWAVKCAPEPQVVLPAGTSTFSAVSCFTPVCGPWALRGRAWRETGAEEQAPPAVWASALGAPLSHASSRRVSSGPSDEFLSRFPQCQT